MRFLYVDESGSTTRHHEPLLDGETPLFVLAGLILDPYNWRAYDREYLALKKEFFAKEIKTSGKRPELFEVKGNKLLSPHNAASKRNEAFAQRVLKLSESYNGSLLCFVKRKNPHHVGPTIGLYGTAMHVLAERFNSLLSDAQTAGAMIVDAQVDAHNQQMIASHLSYVFGHVDGKQLDRIWEAPLFTHSYLTAGLQIVDILSYIIYAHHLRKHPACLNPDRYAHIEQHWDKLAPLEYLSRNKAVRGFCEDL